MGRVMNAIHHWLAIVAVVLVLMGLTMWGTPSPVGGAPAAATAAGLSVFVGYAEDKETRTPDPAQFPVPWVGAPNTSFLGGTVPGQAACGTLSTCYDAGAIRLDNPGPTAVTVNQVSVDDHSSIPGGMVFNNLWGSFAVPAGKSVILTENPPADNPGYDNFDTSGFPSTCTPLTVAPTVTITVGGVASTLVDSTHVLDSGGVDAGSCSPKRDESIQWRPIGAPGSDSATLTLGPSTTSAFAGQPITETATLLDGGGEGIPNAVVDFTVASGPDAGQTGTGVTNSSGNATFTYAGAQGEDELSASVTTVGSFQSNSARILWTNDSATGWAGTRIGAPRPAGRQSFDPTSGTWTVRSGGAGITGTSDQFRFVSQTQSGDGSVSAHVTSQTDSSANAKAGVMLRASTDPASPYYAVLVSPGAGIKVQERSVQGGTTTKLANPTGTTPAYLEVTRAGNTFTASTSPDGVNWTAIAGSTFTMNPGPTMLAGLAVTSHSAAQQGTVTMDTVTAS